MAALCAAAPHANLNFICNRNTPFSAVCLPLILKPAQFPPCTTYCGLRLTDDPYQPPNYQTCFADEFDCGELLDYWVVQPQMTAASYTPPATGYAAIAGQYPRLDWRPVGGNIRFAWRGFQGADGYGVEISYAAHGDWGSTVYFTGAMFYTLLDITTPGGGQFIFPSCQEQYFWRLHLLPQYKIRDTWAIRGQPPMPITLTARCIYMPTGST